MKNPKRFLKLHMLMRRAWCEMFSSRTQFKELTHTVCIKQSLKNSADGNQECVKCHVKC